MYQQANSRLGEGRFVLTSPKSRSSERAIELPKFYSAMLSEYMAARSISGRDFRFFRSRRDVPIGENTINAAMSKYCGKAGMPKFRWHMFRHTEATFLSDAGVSPDTVSEFMGHSSYEVTKKYYLHRDESGMDEVSRLLDTRFRKLMEKG